MTIFIRSDIYAAIHPHARESDKLPIRKIEWNDPELLGRVIEKRIMTSDPQVANNAEVWNKYFVDQVSGVLTKDFLISSAFPRPRDLIYLVRASLQHAVNRGHTKIQEKDILSGLEQYSSFAFASLMAEGTPQFRPLQDFMVQLFGGPSILTDDEIRDALQQSGLGITNLDYVTSLLQELTFLSYETSQGHFDFAYDQEEKTKLTVLARRTSRTLGKTRYQIHPAFHAYLELEPIDVTGQQPMPFLRQ